MKSEFEEKLENMNPKKLTHDEKAYMWSQIKSEIVPGIKASSKSFNFRKFLFIPALITAFIAGSMGTAVVFADSATPGDFLFPVDVAAEKILLTLTFGDSNDELQLRFAEERLDEVKSLLALAHVGDVSTSTATSTGNGTSGGNDSNSTTTDDGSGDNGDSGNDTSTSTDDGTPDQDTVNGSDNSGGVIDPEHIDRAQIAFLIALEHLENAREGLLAKGNDLGVAVIDDMIAELTALAEDHIINLEDFKVKVKEDDDEIKISIDVKSNEIKTKFRFEQDLDGGDDDTEIEVSANGSGSKVKIDDGEFKISQSVTEQNISNNGSSKSKNKRVEICHTSFGKHGKQETKKISEQSLEYYLDHGDTLGPCYDEDDDRDEDRDDDENEDEEDDDEKDNSKKVKICHKGNTIKVSTFSQWAHLTHGDHKGECDDDEDEDDDGDDEETTPPTILNLSASVQVTSADVSFSTDEETTSKVWYSTSSSVALESPTPFVSDDSFKTSHSLTIDSLSASTTYFLAVEVTDKDGNTTVSLERTITTLPKPNPGDVTSPVISGVATNERVNAADISWNTDEDSDSAVWFSDTSPVNSASPTDFVSSGALVQNHFLTVNSLTASTTYFFIVESKDGAGNKSTSSEQSFTTEAEPVDDTPPVISSIVATPTTTEATVTWETNEGSDSKVFFSTISPVDTDIADHEDSNTLVTSHSINLTGLTPDTTYFYVVASADADSNKATSTEQSFATLPEPELVDEAAPIISGILSSEIASTTVTVSWSTNENADSTVYYGTEDPLDTETATSISSGTLTQSHSLDLTSLVASTTYQYILVSSDGSGNTATSSQQTFVTIGE